MRLYRGLVISPTSASGSPESQQREPGGQAGQRQPAAGGNGSPFAWQLADPILFDLDGTLTESGPGIMACARHALAEVGHPGLDDDTLRRFVGPPLLEGFMTLAGLDEQAAWRAVQAYRERFLAVGMFENAVYPGIPELLSRLRAAERTLVVATSKVESFAERIVEHFGLARFFADVVGSNLDGTRSAKAEVVSEALRRIARTEHRADRAVMIGDRTHDVRGARANGLPAVGVLWGYGSRAELATAGAQELVTDPGELGALLLLNTF